jgi:molybdenum cofactor biosynthesis protein B
LKKAHESHREAAPAKLGFYIVTVSSSRFAKKTGGKRFLDESGDLAEAIIEKSGHLVAGRELIDDDREMVVDALNDGTMREDVDVVVFTGGTGVSPRDLTVDAVRPLFEKEIEGFGEVMRAVSYAKIGSPAMLSRATAGLRSGKLIICLPGSPDGVETGLNLFIDDIPHVIFVARKPE